MICRYLHKNIFLLGLILIFCLFLPHKADAALSNEQLEQEAARQKEKLIIVQYNHKAPVKRQSMTSNQAHQPVKRRYSVNPELELLELDSSIDADNFISNLKQDPQVRFAEKNHKLKLFSYPDDPYFPEQWALTRIQAPAAWELLPPGQQDIIVAVIDSGINSDHPDLGNRIAPGGYNFLLENDDISDLKGHGTAVAGVIAAETNNGTGIAGVAGPGRVKILPLKTSDSNGDSYVSDVIEAIEYAIEQQVEVINLSMGSTRFSETERAAIQRAIDSGICVVASAGNDGITTYNYPASYDGVISVGSIREDGEISSFSNRNDRVDLTAPGEAVYSCHYNGSYSKFSGTSFSAPAVAAAIALLLNANPALTPAEIAGILESSASDLGPAGKDSYFGYGVVNVISALQQIPPEDVDINEVLTALQEQLNQNLGEYFTASASGTTIHVSIQNGKMESSIQDAFAIESLLSIVLAIDQSYPLQRINIAGSSYTREDIVDNLSSRVDDIKNDVVVLVNNPAISSYGDIKLGDLAGKSISVVLAGKEISLELSQPDECFIATAAFGSKFQPAVVLLRHFRDDYLLSNSIGTALVDFYYHVSPPMADFISNSGGLKAAVRIMLLPFIALVYMLYHPLYFVLLAALILFIWYYFHRIQKLPGAYP